MKQIEEINVLIPFWKAKFFDRIKVKDYNVNL
jgi:hypothetical protein